MDRVFTKPRVCMHVCLSVCESIINIMQLCVRSFGWFCALQFHTVRTRHGRLCRPNRLLRLWLCITYTAGYLGDAELMSERRRSRNCITYWVFTRSDRRTDRSVWLVCPTIVSYKRFVRPVGQTVGRIKHVWFRPTADPTVEACGHYVRLVGPTGQSDNQSRCSVGGIIIS